jgi:hypothetical protein
MDSGFVLRAPRNDKREAAMRGPIRYLKPC